MNHQAACLCMGCGKTHLIPGSEISIEYLEPLNRKRVRDYPCPECGCELILVDDPET